MKHVMMRFMFWLMLMKQVINSGEYQAVFPNFKHLYTKKMFREVATTPTEELIRILENAYFAVKGVDKIP